MTGIAYTFATITAAWQTWLDDTDVDWTAPVPLSQIVALAENRVILDTDLTVFDQVSVAQQLLSSNTTGLVARPTNLIVTDTLGYQKAGSTKFLPIHKRSLDWVYDYYDPAITGAPKYYAEVDTVNWMLAPKPDQTYTLVNWGPYPAVSLNDQATATWLSTQLGELLFYAGLIEISIVLKYESQRMRCTQEYQQRLESKKVLLRQIRRKNIESLHGNALELPDGKTPGQNPTQE